jgi:hypothetical protein
MSDCCLFLFREKYSAHYVFSNHPAFLFLTFIAVIFPVLLRRDFLKITLYGKENKKSEAGKGLCREIVLMICLLRAGVSVLPSGVDPVVAGDGVRGGGGDKIRHPEGFHPGVSACYGKSSNPSCDQLYAAISSFV